MARMTALAKSKVNRIIGVGYPGTGKTGSLACLANAGYNLRILDVDGNAEPLYQFVEEKNWSNIDIKTFEEKWVMPPGAAMPKIKGTPKVFPALWSALDDWSTTDEKNKDISLGSIRDWSPREILVVDGVTGVTEAAMSYTLQMQGRSPLNRRIQDWGTAAAAELAFFQEITAADIPCHVIVFSHLKTVGPKLVDAKDDTKGLTEEMAEQLNETMTALIPTRLFPTAVGQDLARNFTGNFPVAVHYEARQVGNKIRRLIHTLPRTELDIKVPLADVPTELPIEDGLLTLFKALSGPAPTTSPGGKKNGK